MKRIGVGLGMLVLACAAQGVTSVAVGGFYIDGDYGAETETTMHYMPLTVGYRRHSLKLSATTSYLTIDGPPGFTQGAIDGNGALPASGRASGMGDSWLKAAYDFSLQSRYLQLRPQLKIKIPTADEDKGLGTGASDYTAQVDAFYFVQGWWPYVTAGYRWRGDGSYTLDEGGRKLKYSIDLENGPVLGGGFYKPLTASSSLTVNYEHRAPSLRHLPATEELLVTCQYQFDAHWISSLSAGTGFTSRSADKIFGLQLEHRF